MTPGRTGSYASRPIPRVRVGFAGLLVVASLGCAGAGESNGNGAGMDGPGPDASLDAPLNALLEVSLRTADSIVASWVEKGPLPGAVLSVARNGRVVHERAFGFRRLHGYGAGQYLVADSESGTVVPGPPERLADAVPMTVETAFDLASVTKVMATTFAIMMLVDRGDLDLDAPVSAVLPDFVGGGKDAITPRHLLVHRAGLYQWQPVYYSASSPAEAYSYIRELPLAWPVGEGRHYSDLGFMLLGRIVESLSGMPLDVFVRDALYAPLGLDNTGFGAGTTGPVAATSHGNPFEHRMVHDPEFGYVVSEDPEAWDGWRRHTLVGEVNDGNAHHAFRGVAGHAGLLSTASDLQSLLGVLMAGGMGPDRRYVAEEVVAEFLTSAGDGQALGWQVPEDAPEGSFAHTGFTGTWVLGVPSSGLSVVLLTNRQNGGVDEESRYPDLAPLHRSLTAVLLPVGGSAIE